MLKDYPIRIIDIAALIGPIGTKHRVFNCPEQLLSFMDLYSLTDAVVYHTMATFDNNCGNNLISVIAAKSSGRIHPCHVLDHIYGSNNMIETEILLNKLKQTKPACVRLFPKDKVMSLNPFYCGDLFEILDMLEMPVLIDRSQLDLDQLPDLLACFKKVKLVFLRYDEARQLFPLLKKAENLYFDISIMVHVGLIEEIVNKYGPGRLLFSSGLPLFEPSGPLGLVSYARIPDSAKERIFGLNWLDMEGGIKW